MTEVRHGLGGRRRVRDRDRGARQGGSALRYRGVDIEEIVGRVPSRTYRPLIDGSYHARPPHPPSRTDLPGHTATSASTSRPRSRCSARLRLQADLRRRRRAGPRGPRRVAVMVLSSPRARAASTYRSSRSETSTRPHARRALPDPLEGRGEPEHVKAIDAYWSSAAEHGMNTSTFTAASSPRPGRRRHHLLGRHRRDQRPLAGARLAGAGMVARRSRARRRRFVVRRGSSTTAGADRLRPPRLHAEEPLARAPARTARQARRPALRRRRGAGAGTLAGLRERRPDRVLEANIEFWARFVLELGQGPHADIFTSGCRLRPHGGWSAHVLRSSSAPATDPTVGDLHRHPSRQQLRTSRAWQDARRLAPGLGPTPRTTSDDEHRERLFEASQLVDPCAPRLLRGSACRSRSPQGRRAGASRCGQPSCGICLLFGFEPRVHAVRSR